MKDASGPADGHQRLTDLYRSHWSRLYGYAARRCGTPADAADVVAEVFVTAWRRIRDVPEIDDEALLWLYGVARLTLANHHRGVRRQDRLGASLQAAFVDHHHGDPADLFVRSDRQELVHRALLRLPDQDRELLALTSWEGLTAAAAATVLGITAPAARARLSRARRRFAQILAYDKAISAPVPTCTASMEGTT